MPSGFSASSPIGVFDSGIGGLSVLRHIRARLPHEHLLYAADSGFAPYGGKTEQAIVARTLAIAEFLLERGAKALVVACNTATGAALGVLRERYPALLTVGVEPGLKPAAALTKTHTVGVLATERTLAGARFALLHQQVAAATGVRFLLQPCIGLADQIEKGELRSAATAALVRRYVAPLIGQGADTLVLGCTHYPFVQPLIEDAVRRIAAQPVGIVDTGEAIARQLARLLAQHGLQRQTAVEGTLTAFTTGSRTSLATAFSNLLKLRPEVGRIAAEPEVEQ
ncbi:MAG: murI [Herminiimonas sp.]|nr:murI [Herminiimonas sp.]